ncbi:anthranilate synthase component I [bacterium]|nr:MAG: anthranilate synthase component I [bacterium]
MTYPSSKEFLNLSKKYNLIPVYTQVNADLDTPVSAFLKISKGDYAFLLESVEGQEKIARYSFLGSSPSLIFRGKGRDIWIIDPRRKTVRRFLSKVSPLDEIRKIMQGYRPATIKGLPRFYGGLVGYIGYEAVRLFEKLPDKNKNDLKLADYLFILTDNLLIFDRVNHTIKIVANVFLPESGRTTTVEKERLYIEALRKIEEIKRDFEKSISLGKRRDIKPGARIKVNSNFTPAGFKSAVAAVKAYIKKGDIIQGVLSQRFKVGIGSKDPFDIYRNLRSLNPSPYMFFLKLKELILIGSSPEMLLRCEDGLLEIRPIAGTRPRGANQKEDRKLEKELLNDAKEKAEHLMLVDLGRNDLGRVAKTGSLKVRDFMRVEKYSHVMHLVSEVAGVLDKRYDIYDALKACFPAGTVTGSPKIRAMEIIDELENLKRGPYAGCVGYFSFSQNIDTCITIRTIVIKGNSAYLQAGAGIVADSKPQKEYLESVNKAKALIEAIGKST